MDLGKGLGRWKTIPTRRRWAVTSWAKMFWPSRRISPSRRALRTVSCMRLRVRRRVDLPQPEVPIREVTLLVAMPMLMSKRTCLLPYQKLTLEMVMRMERAAGVSRAAALVTMGGKFTDKAGLTEACIGYDLGTAMPRERIARATMLMTKIKPSRTSPAAQA